MINSIIKIAFIVFSPVLIFSLLKAFSNSFKVDYVITLLHFIIILLIITLVQFSEVIKKNDK